MRADSRIRQPPRQGDHAAVRRAAPSTDRLEQILRSLRPGQARRGALNRRLRRLQKAISSSSRRSRPGSRWTSPSTGSDFAPCWPNWTSRCGRKRGAEDGPSGSLPGHPDLAESRAKLWTGLSPQKPREVASVAAQSDSVMRDRNYQAAVRAIAARRCATRDPHARVSPRWRTQREMAVRTPG